MSPIRCGRVRPRQMARLAARERTTSLDTRLFDALTRSLSAGASRRRTLGALAALPAVGGLLAVIGAEDAGARKKKRKRKKKKKKACTPQPTAQTCAAKCGTVTNNCKQAVNCGSCGCNPPCGACETCTSARVCQPCANCCDGNGVCQAGTTNAACGGSGTCDVCTGNEQCQNGQCVCVPDCTGKCNGGHDGCGGTCTGTCPGGKVCEDGICTGCDVCASGCLYDSIAAAVTAASLGATIVICPGYYSNTQLSLTKNITIVGSGTSGDQNSSTRLLGGANGRILTVNAGVTATVSSLWISDGTTSGNGAGVVNRGTLTLERVAMSNNIAQGNGGALFNEGTLTLTDTPIFTSQAAFGGAIYNNGTAASTTLVRTRLESNTATSPAPSGGGILNNGGTLSIDGDSSFTGNSPDTCVSINGGTGCPA